MNNNITSVIITTFNRKKFVREAIESVLSQTFRDFELIVIDDGSFDGTGEMIAKDYPEIQYIYQNRFGISSARNTGIKAAACKFISFLDSDDLWEKNKLAEQMDYFEQKSDCNVCYTNEIWLKNGVHLNQKKKHRKYGGYIFEQCLPLCIISPSSVIIHRTVFENIGCFDESLRVCEDYDFWLRMSLKYWIHFIDKKLIVKRGGHSDQLSKKYWGMDRYRILAMEKLLGEDSLSDGHRHALHRHLYEKCKILTLGYENRSKPGRSEFYRKKMNNYMSLYENEYNAQRI